jgi:hypothetical protein
MKVVNLVVKNPQAAQVALGLTGMKTWRINSGPYGEDTFFRVEVDSETENDFFEWLVELGRVLGKIGAYWYKLEIRTK